ncbi:MAG: Zn-dependent hydrolase [Cyclobacteriaceae bacterium]
MNKIRLIALALIWIACEPSKKELSTPVQEEEESLLDVYTPFTLTADLSSLSNSQKQMIGKLIEASDIMDELFWQEAYGTKKEALALTNYDDEKEFIKINYGPWDRLNGNAPFIEGIGPKPAGANFYPDDMTKSEFEAADLPDKASLYTFLRRDDQGNLITIPYNEMFAEQVQRAAQLLKESAELAEDPGFRQYLELRSEALITDEYQPSDMAWMDMKSNQIDVVIGPIENYEDGLFNYKAAHEAYVLIKDMDWSKRLEKYTSLLPELQKGIPVPDQYKQEKPGANADLNAYDVIYYAGDCNAGSKTIAINLPNDEEVQLQKGSRRLQLKNAMKAKYEKILIPIADQLINDEQRQHVNFDAFFANTMFHEVAHGLGIKNTINGKGTVRSALKEHYSALEEGKADVLGLYMINQLIKSGEVAGTMESYYTTFLASIFRSVRFGASSAHGKANMIRFNYFKEMGAFSKDADGKYTVDYEKMTTAMNGLTEIILTLQGDGDYEGVSNLVAEKGLILADLQSDLDKLAAAGIPVDVVFNQGVDVLGL